MEEQILQELPEQVKMKYERRLVWIVRLSSILMCALLLAFFIVVIRNTSAINEQVEYVKESPYPISVAAGHIETDLVHLQTFIKSETSHKLGADVASRQEERKSLDDVINDLYKQMNVIKASARPGDVGVDRMERLLFLLEKRADNFFQLSWSGEQSRDSYEDVTSYAERYLQPVITTMLNINDDALNSTSQKVETMYMEVNNSISVLLSFTVIMAIAVVIVATILIIVINIRGHFEKYLRESLAVALEETNKANEAKSAFMANMSHDIRTPMNAIVGLTQIASENIDDRLRVEQCLTRITTSSQHLLSLINDVLDMNKIESGRVTLTEEVFSIDSLASEIESLFQSQPEAGRRKSEVIVENVFADLLVGDAMRLRQILLNLVSNALKYTNEGDVARMIVKENHTSRKDTANVVFIVEDTGIGMKKEFINRIFEPFERENNDFTIFTEGTGLGMAITKNLVDLMGGTINVESELGIGTSVTISIDFKIASEDSVVDKSNYSLKLANEIHGLEVVNQGDAATENATEGEKEPEGSKGSEETSKKEPSDSGGKPVKKSKKITVSGNVLVVEDNDINMEIAKQLIGSRGATVHEAFDGLEAVKTIGSSNEGDYDLIFMDLQMPHMNGIEATESIRKYLAEHGRTQIPIVAMTANAFESDQVRAKEAGMNDFMSKPINIHQLEEVLLKYLS